jgi:hypothetical protein
MKRMDNESKGEVSLNCEIVGKELLVSCPGRLSPWIGPAVPIL